MKKIFHLAKCTTCQGILTELQPGKDFELQEIKTENVSAKDLDAMAKFAGSYEALFSRRALKFRGMGLHEKELTEKDYRQLILDEYTFLKRPVIQIGKEYFIGNTKSVVAAAKAKMKST